MSSLVDEAIANSDVTTIINQMLAAADAEVPVTIDVDDDQLRAIAEETLNIPAEVLAEMDASEIEALLEPFVKLARTIRAYRSAIEATIEYGLTNGIAESNNASIGRIRANARGFHHPEAFISMIMLDRGGLTPALGWNQAA